MCNKYVEHSLTQSKHYVRVRLDSLHRKPPLYKTIERKFAFLKTNPKTLSHSIGSDSIAFKSSIETLMLLNICCKAASQNDKSCYFPGEHERVSQDTQSHVQNMSLSSKARTNKILLCILQLKFSLTTGK